MPSISDTPVALGSSSYLIQNLGPDNLYVGESTVTVDDGVKVAAGEALAVGSTNSPVFAVSDGTSDVRTLGRGMGIFSPAAAPVP